MLVMILSWVRHTSNHGKTIYKNPTSHPRASYTGLVYFKGTGMICWANKTNWARTVPTCIVTVGEQLIANPGKATGPFRLVISSYFLKRLRCFKYIKRSWFCWTKAWFIGAVSCWGSGLEFPMLLLRLAQVNWWIRVVLVACANTTSWTWKNLKKKSLQKQPFSDASL